MTLEAPGRAAPAVVALLRRFVAPLMRVLHRSELHGVASLPRDGAYLLVANHSAGIGLAELCCFAALWVGKRGEPRPIAGYAHPIGFRVPGMHALLRALGAVPSTYEAAQATLAAGVPLLVFPGGDHETLRPAWQAGRVDFGGRRGFLKVAARAGVPVVPMGIRGAHLTAPILLRSRALASLLVLPRLAGVKRWGISVLGVAGALALALAPWSLPLRALAIWLWLSSALVFLPWLPLRISFRIGAPIAPEELSEGVEPRADALARVEAEVQALVGALPEVPARPRGGPD
jgi:1-acyl-sn-glycerol-3-phosphate acyltransferase